MNDPVTNSIRESYDRLAEEYTRRISGELQHKPLDRQLLDRFAKQTQGRGEVCETRSIGEGARNSGGVELMMKFRCHWDVPRC